MADAKIKIRGGAGNAVQIQSRDVDAAAPSNTEVLAWNATDSEWEPTTAGASASFKTISVSGQDDVVADSAADTLTLAEGSNVTITPNARTDTVTIAAAGGGSTEWTDTGTVLHPADSSGTLDNVVSGGTTTANADIVLGVDGAAVFNEQGADVDFRVEGDTEQNLLVCNAGTDRVGIGTASPTTPLQVFGGQINATATANPGYRIATTEADSTDADRAFFAIATSTDAFVTGAAANDTILRARSPGSGELHIGMGSAIKATVTSGGNLGVGATSPNAKVDINAGSADNVEAFAVSEGPTQRFRMVADYSPSGNLLHFNGNGNRTLFTFDTDSGSDVVKAGNVGCGISPETADEKFVLDGNFAIKEQSSAPSATADYSKLYSREFGNDANTVLLLHMDGSNGGTTFTDSSAGGATHSFAAVGNAHTDTGTKKFGTASAEFDGTGDSVHLSTQHSDFDVGTGDFTLDFWVNFSATTASQYLFEIGTYTTGFSLLWSNSHYLAVYVANATKVIDGSEAGNDWDPTPGTWYHVTCQRRARGADYATITIWIDGNELVSVTSTAARASISSATHGVSVGSEAATPGGTCVNGFMDEVRFSNIARYKGSPNVPGGAYPLTGLFSKDGAGSEIMLGGGGASTVVSNETTAQAWISFVGTGTVSIQDSYYVSSLADNGVGAYTITYSAAFANANYAVAGACNDISYGGTLSIYNTTSKLTGSLKIATHDKDTQEDAGLACVVCFGDF